MHWFLIFNSRARLQVGNRFMYWWMKCTKLFIKPRTGFSGSMKCTNWWWMKFTKLVKYEFFWNWLKFEYEYSKICIVSVVRAQNLCYWWNPRWCRCFGCLGCVCLVCCLVCMIHKIGLYTSSLRYEREYPWFWVVSVVLGILEISYGISLRIRLQALDWLETVSKNILVIG